ncbi:Glucose-6-phosphate exchanger SLC37A2 [Plecturocebus cupreus]
MSRKPISIVKSRLHQNCSEQIKPINDTHSLNDTMWCSWAPFDKDNYKELLGAVDNAFLVAYAIGMFISGVFGERLPLRYYLSAGMLLSGLFTSLFGLGYFWDIHVLWYFVVIQVCNGLVQTTGWPSVVTCVGNWFGKGKRGLIMGIWNSHTSVGNILGSLIAGIWVNGQWGLSFVVPGIITATMGVITFLFLIEYPEDVDCTPPQHHGEPAENQDNPEDPGNSPYSIRENSLETVAKCSKEPSEEPTAISFFGALRIPGVVEFSLCLLFAKLVSYTFLYWLPLYIFNVAHFSAKEAGDLSTLFDAGGIIGGIMAGLISDYTNGRATTCCVMLILAAPMMFLYNHIGQDGITSSIGEEEVASPTRPWKRHHLGGPMRLAHMGAPAGGVAGRAEGPRVLLPWGGGCGWHLPLTGLSLCVPVMLIVCGGLVNGPYALITTAVSADLGTHKSLKGNAKALSTVTAIIDGTGSIGAALGPLLAGLISPTGWNNVFYMLISADVLACLLLCRLVYKEILAWKVSLSRGSGSSMVLTHQR